MKLNTVLIPLDESPVAETVLPFVKRIAGPLDFEVVLVEVLEPVGPMPDGLSYMTADTVAARIPGAKKYLEARATELRRTGLTVRTIVRTGEAAREIANAARESGADMVAMTTNGRSGFGKLLFGSVAERVLREADVPVLMMRIGDHAAKEAVAEATPSQHGR